MKQPAQRTGYRLRFEMVVECGPVAPHIIASNLDQSGAKHDAEDQPAEQSDDRHRWCAFRKGTQVKQGAKEDREKSGFEELDLPSVSIPVLPDVNERHIKEPENSEQQCIRKACHHDTGKRESDPRRSQEDRVGMAKP